jgi:glycosyltransferase involved in cell wall biosynthesis
VNDLFNIVMLVRDRPRLTNQCLESLYANTRVGFSLTIVDDASQVETWQLLNRWLLSHIKSPFQILHNGVSRGTGAARNQGVLASRARFGRDGLLYLTDNDALFLPGWDVVLLDAHRNYPTCKIVGGYCHPYMQPKCIGVWREAVGGWGYRLTTRDAVSGMSWLLSWATWEQWGPLEENALGVRQSEDWAFSQRVIQSGYYVGAVDPSYVLNCGVHDTFGELTPGWEIASPSSRRLRRWG